MLAAWDSHLTHPSLPRSLTARLVRRASRTSAWRGTPFATNELSPDTYGGFLVAFAEQFVVDQRLVEAGDARRGRTSSARSRERGEFYFACIQFCFAAKRPR